MKVVPFTYVTITIYFKDVCIVSRMVVHACKVDAGTGKYMLALKNKFVYKYKSNELRYSNKKYYNSESNLNIKT